MKQADLVQYCLELPGAYQDYPFDRETIAMRHAGNQKVFALFLYAHGRLHVNVKCEPMRADFLRRAFRGVIPGYHMNKQHWNSVFLDMDVPDTELMRMIDHSYELTRPRRKLKQQEQKP